MATFSNILAWKIPGTEEPGELQLMGLQRGGHNWVTEHNRSEHRWQSWLVIDISSGGSLGGLICGVWCYMQVDSVRSDLNCRMSPENWNTASWCWKTSKNPPSHQCNYSVKMPSKMACLAHWILPSYFSHWRCCLFEFSPSYNNIFTYTHTHTHTIHSQCKDIVFVSIDTGDIYRRYISTFYSAFRNPSFSIQFHIISVHLQHFIHSFMTHWTF